MFEKLEKNRQQRQKNETLLNFKLGIVIIIVVSLIFGYVSGFIMGSLLQVGMPVILAVTLSLVFLIVPVWLARKLVLPELKAMYLKINDTNQ